MTMTDDFAHDVAEHKFGLPWCLHIPIAARDEASVHNYVGRVIDVVVGGSPSMALLVETEPSKQMDSRLPIWQEQGASNLFRSPQLWVHVDYKGYRRAYAKAFPSENIRGLDVDHVLNRHHAKVKDFTYVRLIAISQAANRCSGGLSEKWAIEYHSSEKMRKINLASAHPEMSFF